jgi:hypothetical protein
MRTLLLGMAFAQDNAKLTAALETPAADNGDLPPENSTIDN